MRRTLSRSLPLLLLFVLLLLVSLLGSALAPTIVVDGDRHDAAPSAGLRFLLAAAGVAADHPPTGQICVAAYRPGDQWCRQSFDALAAYADEPGELLLSALLIDDDLDRLQQPGSDGTGDPLTDFGARSRDLDPGFGSGHPFRSDDHRRHRFQGFAGRGATFAASSASAGLPGTPYGQPGRRSYDFLRHQQPAPAGGSESIGGLPPFLAAMTPLVGSGGDPIDLPFIDETSDDTSLLRRPVWHDRDSLDLPCAPNCLNGGMAHPSPSLAIPEPATLALFALGVVGLFLGRRARGWRGDSSREDGVAEIRRERKVAHRFPARGRSGSGRYRASCSGGVGPCRLRRCGRWRRKVLPPG